MSDKFEFIDGLKYAYPIARMCAWLSVSRSGFYDWRCRPLSATAERRESIKDVIREIFEGSDQTYGYRRVHAALARQGRPAGPELVRALMRELDLRPCQPRPWRLTTRPDPTAAATPDLVGRDFTADRPGAKLVGDITYIKTWAGWLYLATVIDCHTKMVIGYAMADHMRTSLVTAAIEMAARRIDLPAGAVFHSDRGCQYSSAEFREQAKQFGITASVGRTGVCWDNALAESFNGTLKNERVYRTVYPTREQARADIANYIEIFYNQQRLHSGLGYRTPHEIYDEYQNRQIVA